MNVVGFFEIDEPRNVVFGGKAGDKFVFVLVHSFYYVVGDSCIKSPRLVAHNIHMVGFLSVHT